MGSVFLLRMRLYHVGGPWLQDLPGQMIKWGPNETFYLLYHYLNDFKRTWAVGPDLFALTGCISSSPEVHSIFVESGDAMSSSWRVHRCPVPTIRAPAPIISLASYPEPDREDIVTPFDRYKQPYNF